MESPPFLSSFKLAEMLWEYYQEEDDEDGPFFRGLMRILNENDWRVEKKKIPSIYG